MDAALFIHQFCLAYLLRVLRDVLDTARAYADSNHIKFSSPEAHLLAVERVLFALRAVKVHDHPERPGLERSKIANMPLEPTQTLWLITYRSCTLLPLACFQAVLQKWLM